MSNERSQQDHRPDPEFVDRLEWQLRSQLRREREFEARTRRRGWIRAAATVVLSLAFGYATAIAAQQLGDRGEARYLRIAAEGQLELAEMRVRWIAETLQELAGRSDPDDYRTLQFELQQASWDRDDMQRQLEEINAAGGEIRQELTAPLVGGRDFVSERLEGEQQRAGLRIAMMQDARDRNTEPDNDAMFRAELRQLVEEQSRIGAELDLRADFLTGRISGDEIVRQQRRELARERLAAAQSRVDEITRWQSRVARGSSDGDEGSPRAREMRAVEYELAAARLDLRLARFELRMAGESGDAE
jgi:hypothetical protein